MYYDFLEEKNKVMNLTAISGEKDVAELHFLDSLSLLTLGSFEGKSVIDIGSGAGFPGIPMKLAVPTLSLIMLDAQLKRIGFLKELCDTLRLTDVSPIRARAEEAAHTDLRESFDFAVSRAVARLNVLAELCLPFVKEGGAFIAMKGTESDEEIIEAGTAIKTLGAEVDKINDYQ
ncbi:MAG: 16S rRNA (guanine(527)-N(7))-methyltransferase RsmG, partial [Clostridiales bacterium]|nr:16S rRNA (guanine(527)-N(7))-methyltransferase RsmG [Clostridiales bacterium]